MALQYSVALRNAQANQIESTIGANPKLRILTGSPPSSCADSQTGTVLVEIDLPSDWLTTASNGQVQKSGTWSGTAGAAGTAGYFRIVDSGGSTCHMQGTVTATGGGGDMTLDNTNIASGQSVTVNTFTITRGNA